MLARKARKAAKEIAAKQKSEQKDENKDVIMKKKRKEPGLLAATLAMAKKVREENERKANEEAMRKAKGDGDNEEEILVVESHVVQAEENKS